MGDWKEILSDHDVKLSDEDMLRYLDENTPEEEKYLIEKKLTNHSFESEAIEGLQKIKQPERLHEDVKQLNKKLHQHLISRKQRKEKGKVINFRWVLLAILLLLFICITTYIVIWLHHKNAVSTHLPPVNKELKN